MAKGRAEVFELLFIEPSLAADSCLRKPRDSPRRPLRGLLRTRAVFALHAPASRPEARGRAHSGACGRQDARLNARPRRVQPEYPVLIQRDQSSRPFAEARSAAAFQS